MTSFFAFDLKYYAQPLSFNNTLPTLANLLGLMLFFVFLILIWHRALPSYRRLFNSGVALSDFILNNIRTNLTIILPWLILSFFFDLLNTLPITQLENWAGSPWGELLFFSPFLC